MLLRTKLKHGVFILGLLTAFGAASQAQQATTPAPQNPAQGPARMGRGPGRGFRRGPGRDGFGPGMMRELNLTDAQRQQMRAIVQQSFDGNKTTRDELRQLAEKRRLGTLTAEDQARAKTLHEQMRAAMIENRTKMAGVLTADQKAKLEELRKDRKANHQRRGGARRRFGVQPGPSAAPTQKPPTGSEDQ